MHYEQMFLRLVGKRGRKMKRPIAAALSVALLLMISAEWTEAQNDRPAITQTMNDYFASFADLGPAFDMRRALSFFHEPSMLITTTRAANYLTRGEVEVGWVNAFVVRQRERGYARQEVPQLHVRQMSSNVAFASVEIVRYKAGGELLERVGASYVLRRTNEGWKITAVITHDPDNVLRLE
jgi:NTF2-like protein (DUF6841)